jgi:hypothetical protein
MVLWPKTMALGAVATGRAKAYEQTIPLTFILKNHININENMKCKLYKDGTEIILYQTRNFIVSHMYWLVFILLHAQSTYIPREPLCLSLRWIWDPQPPLSQASLSPPSPGTKGVYHWYINRIDEGV